MKRSVLLRRTILLLLTSLLLSGILSSCIYIFVTQKMFIQTKAEELTPLARTVAEVMATQMDQENNHGIKPLLDRNNKDFLGASLHIYDQNGDSLMMPLFDDKKNDKGPKISPEEYVLSDAFQADLDIVLTGIETSGIRQSSDDQSYLVVGVPIYDDTLIVGAVFFTKAMSELTDAMQGMNVTLLISSLIAFIIMLIPSYFAAKRLTVPIRQMNQVARSMAKGDFSIRADETQKGEIGELAISMNHFAEASKNLEQTRRDYVANISHELRTPISSIRAMGETLRDGMVKNDTKRNLFYQNIVRESMRLSRLVDDLLELSRLQSSNVAMKKQVFDFREVIQNVCDTYIDTHTEEAQFKLDWNMENELLVYSNLDRVEQVLVILLDNAFKHSPVKGNVTLTIKEFDGFIQCQVSNHGEMIPAEDLACLFDRFYKVDKSHSQGGTGLGLSIAREIILGLDEQIEATSDSEETCFRFTIHKR